MYRKPSMRCQSICKGERPYNNPLVLAHLGNAAPVSLQSLEPNHSSNSSQEKNSGYTRLKWHTTKPFCKNPSRVWQRRWSSVNAGSLLVVVSSHNLCISKAQQCQQSKRQGRRFAERRFHAAACYCLPTTPLTPPLPRSTRLIR